MGYRVGPFQTIVGTAALEVTLELARRSLDTSFARMGWDRQFLQPTEFNALPPEQRADLIMVGRRRFDDSWQVRPVANRPSNQTAVAQ